MKRYSEAFDLAATHGPYHGDPSFAWVDLERYVAYEIKTVRDIYATSQGNDVAKASVVEREGDAGRPRKRLEVMGWRMEGDGRVILRAEFDVATDVCARCGKR